MMQKKLVKRQREKANKIRQKRAITILIIVMKRIVATEAVIKVIIVRTRERIVMERTIIRIIIRI